MKKLFSILTTSVLTLTATISTIACTNATDNNKNNQNEDKQKAQIFKDNVNTFLSKLEFEFVGDKRKDVLITDPKSDFKFTIKGNAESAKDQPKEFATTDLLTDKIWSDKKTMKMILLKLLQDLL